MDALVSIIDQHKDDVSGSLFQATPATVSVSSSGLASDWTADYKVYESNYDSITNGERYGFLFTYEDEDAVSGEVFSASDKAKLDSIEHAAEVNPSAAEIKTLYESNADTNAYDDAAAAKLAGIEAGAEVNQDDAEIKAQYENNADTNAYTDAEKAKLAGIDTGLIGDMNKSVYDTDDDGIVDWATALAVPVINNTGATISKGAQVAIDDYDGTSGKNEIVLADQSTPIAASGTLDRELDDTEEGLLIIQGVASGINTFGLTVNDPLYLDTGGDFTATKPTTGIVQIIGYVLRVDAVNGVILVSVADQEIDSQENVARESFSVTGGTSNEISHGPMLIVELTEIATYTLPQISTLANTDYRIDIKNLSGAAVTLETTGGDTIDGDSDVELLDAENITLYMKATEYKIL
jgi:hypothetical protein